MEQQARLAMFVTVLTVFFALLHITQGAKTTCETSTVPAGRPANITCFFSEDVRLSKKNVKVLKTKFDTDTSESVVDCFWSDSQTFQCDEKEGYLLQDRLVTNTAVVVIPTVSSRFEGTYKCEAVPSDSTDVQVCELRIGESNDGVNVQMELRELQRRVDALNINDMRYLIIAAIAISALSLVIVVLSVFLKDRIIACTQKSSCKNRRRRKSSSNVKECEEAVALKTTGDKVEVDVPHTTMDDKSIGSDDKSLSDLSEIVKNSVKSALLEVSQTDTGTMVISTMSEIQRKWQTRKVPLSNDQSQ